MGFLANLGSGMGSSFLGVPATAAAAGAQSQGLTQLANTLQVTGNVLTGIEGYKQGQFQAQVAKNNAALLDVAAGDTRAAGQTAASNLKTETGRLVASQKAAQAANGVDVNVGSAVEVRDATQALGDMDAMTLQYNAMREAYGYQAQAANERSAASAAKRTGNAALASGALKAGSTLISGASALSDKWASFKRSGVRAA